MWQDLKNIYHLATALFAHIYYRFPARKLTVIGITGTSGKTTTTHMVYEVLKAAGYKVSLLSSIQAIIGGKEFDTGFHVTTPDPQTLPKYLRQAVDRGDTHFVLEVSSHALHQNRAAFISFAVGVLTTLAHEHLDYHKTFENYAKAKFILLHNSKKVVLPYEGIRNSVKDAVDYDRVMQKAITFGLSEGDVTQKKLNLHMKLPGDFNLLDALAAATVGQLLKIPEKLVKHTLENFSHLAGRFEEIPTGKDFRIIIDFAHKPDAIQGILEAAKKQVKKDGRIIVMFGSASERDTLKRPMMGEIAGRLADIIVLTDEDPRREDPMKIIDEIGAGIRNYESRIMNKTLFKIPNRKEAIEFVLTKLAQKDDIVLLLGKGHEKSMSYNGVETPWSEHAVVQETLKNK